MEGTKNLMTEMIKDLSTKDLIIHIKQAGTFEHPLIKELCERAVEFPTRGDLRNQIIEVQEQLQNALKQVVEENRKWSHMACVIKSDPVIVDRLLDKMFTPTSKE